MVKSGAQLLEQAANLPIVGFPKKSETTFSVSSSVEESSIVEKISEKLDVKVRFNRLKRRIRNRSSNIL